MNGRNRRGPDHHLWKGGTSVNNKGYVRRRLPSHPRAGKNGYVYDHILVVEAALGHYLPLSAEVHHVNEKKGENVGGNLVACNDRAYHGLLHQRTRALDACGDANALRCHLCSKYDRQEEIRITSQGRPLHLSCRRKYHRDYKHQLRVYPVKTGEK